jgi:hypothetical protein
MCDNIELSEAILKNQFVQIGLNYHLCGSSLAVLFVSGPTPGFLGRTHCIDKGPICRTPSTGISQDFDNERADDDRKEQIVDTDDRGYMILSYLVGKSPPCGMCGGGGNNGLKGKIDAARQCLLYLDKVGKIRCPRNLITCC